jgi:ribosomal protein S18 acetylase RimI-like enzyme
VSGADRHAADIAPAQPARDVVRASSSVTREARAADAGLVHRLYHATPEYFDIISIPVPTLDEVQTELAAADRDDRRRVELVLERERPPLDDAEAFRDPVTGAYVVAYLDYKLDYPEAGDATVNLLLVHGALHDRGIGRRAIRGLEHRLRGRVTRVLASIYGRNPAARRFWQGLGYTFAIDARPVLDWYAKTLI